MRCSTLWKGTGWVCVSILAVAGSARAATIAVASGGDFQAAIDAAQPGDVITLAPGATYVGNFTLPNKGATDEYITIRSAAADGSLPPAGVRMTPSYVDALPKIKSPNSMSALRTAAGANHWRLMFLEFQANYKGYGDIIELGMGDSTQTDLSQVPYAFVLDRIYVHGDPVMGQKRGIALNSRDTQIVNSWISDCKAVGQDTQAIGGWNGPGNYVIENDYLEAAGENFLLGGSDPPIPNLVTTGVTFRGNYLSKPLAWRDPIVATPANVAAGPAPGAGSLAPGTYYYKVAARVPAGQTTTANSAPSVEVSATVASGTTAGVTITWTPVAGAADYVVYGRASGGENTYWKTTNPYFTDNGAAGASGAPPSATRWSVKNLFELKNAQDVLVEDNVMEHLWVAAQPGYPVVFTPRNQGGTAPWVVVQRVTFQHNIIRHTAGGVNILGTDNLAPSQLTNHIVVRDSLFEDVGSSWGTGAKVFQIGDGGDAITFDHNTIVTDDSTIVTLYGGSASNPTPITGFVYTNNMSEHRKYGIFGANYSPGLSSINAYLPGGIVLADVLAGGNAAIYPAGNYFPTVADWQAQFVDYAGGDYRLAASSPYKTIGTDGLDLGADVAAVTAAAAGALSGDTTATSSSSGITITTTSLPDGTYQQPYAQTLACTGANACGWQLVDGTLPTGISFDPATGTVAGTPTAVETGSLTVTAYDPSWPSNTATATLSLTIDPPPFVVTMPDPPQGQVGVAYSLTPTVSGAVGSAAWSIASGALPAGVNLDPLTGSIAGAPTAWGTTTALVQAQDSWGTDRTDAKAAAITIAPAPLAITTTALPPGTYEVTYQTALTVSGGTGATAWSLVGGALPPGVSLDPSGAMGGVPAALGTFTITVQAVDVNWPSDTATATLALTINAPDLVVLLPPVPDGQVGEPYQLAAAASGAIGAVDWSIASGALPPGLSIDAATGVIAGAPTAAGSYSAVVRAQDSWSASRVATAPLDIVVHAPADIVLYAAAAPVVRGTWSVVADATAAGGLRIWNPDLHAPKLTQALASPANYFELTFQAEAGVPYHLWMRGKADGDDWRNDSAFVQFSGAVDASGAAQFRIGTTSATWVGVEDGTNAGLSGWGWNDNCYGCLAAPIYFAASGAQTIRVQVREDGLSLDQIVLSADRYTSTAPGAPKNDTTILDASDGSASTAPTASASTQTSTREIVLYAAQAPVVSGTWSVVADATAAGGARIWNPDLGAAKLTEALASPANYFEVTFQAEAGVPYHLWMRGKADQDYWGNDSAYVQFSGAVDASGTAQYRIGTTSATWVGIEDGTNAGLSGWGWNDNCYGCLAEPIYFEATGTQTMRVQVREDGLSLDQIVISADQYATSAPGAATNDTTIVPLP